MAGTPRGIPPDTPDVVDMSWEYTGAPVNTTPPSQPVLNINNTVVTGNGHSILQPAERVDNDAPFSRYLPTNNPPQRHVLQPIGRLNRNPATARNVIPLNNVVQASVNRNAAIARNIGPRSDAARAALNITANHHPGQSLLSRGRGSANVATARILPPALTSNARSQRLPNTSSLLQGHHWGARNGGSLLQAGSRPSTNARAPRNTTNDRRFIHALSLPSLLPREQQRFNVTTPAFRNFADDSFQTSPLLRSIQKESIARNQSPRQDPILPQLKRRLDNEATSAGQSEDKYFQGENYFSTIRAMQTTDEGKRRLISPEDEGKTTRSPRTSPTNRHSSSIFFQDLTGSPGHRSVRPITPPKFRGNGRSMPGAWPESPVTPLTLDTSAILLTPPPTPDMSTIPGAWPKSPEPLPFTTIGTAAITPPESPVDESPSVRMEDVAGRIDTATITPPESPVDESPSVRMEDVAGRIDTATIAPPESPTDEWPSAEMEDVPGRIHQLLSIPSRAGAHVSAVIRALFPARGGAGITSFGIPEHNEGPAVWPEGPEEYQNRHLDAWTQNAVLALEETENANWFQHRPYPNARRPQSTQRVSFPENPVTRVKKYAIGEAISYPSPTSSRDETSLLGLSPSAQLPRELVEVSSPSPTSTVSSRDETSLLGLSPPAQLSRESVETVSSPSPTSSLSSDDGLPLPSAEPSTPTKDDRTDPASAQLTQEFENFLLRSDRHKVYRDVEQEEAEKTRQAQAAEQARQAEAEEARKKAEDEARRKIEEDEFCKKSGHRRLPAQSVLEPLTAEWETKLRDILGKRANEVVARTSAGNELDRRDIGKVLPQPGTADDPSGWLNDNVISGYLDSVVDYGLQARGHKRGETPKLHAFNPAFYNNITEKGVESVKRWSRRPKISGKDLLKVEHVFIPINVGGAHWTLLVVSPVWKRIEYFDSLHGSSVAAIRNAKAWIKMELQDAWDEHEWEVVEDPALAGRGKGPRQSNSSDCGVFTITTAKMISLGVDPMAITASDMPLQRKRVVVELVNGGFHGDFEPHIVF